MASVATQPGATMLAAETQLGCEIGGRHTHQSGKLGANKTIGSVFVLGMLVGMAGLIAVEHYGLADSNITSLFFVAPVPSTVSAIGKQSANVVAGAAHNTEPRMSRVTGPDMSDGFEAFLSPSKTMSPCSRRKALAAAAGLAVAGIGAPALAAAAATVKMGSDDGQLIFVPAEVTVCVGDTVNFVMNAVGPHAVKFFSSKVPAGVDADDISMDDGELYKDKGKTHEATFEIAGDYEYFCPPHKTSNMKGKVVVKA